MCVVSNDYGGLGGGWDVGGGWYACGTSPSRYASFGRLEPELVSLPGKVLTRDVTRSLRFVVHAAGWVHSMVLH